MTIPLMVGFDRLMKKKAVARKSYPQQASSGISGFSEEAMQGLADLDARSALLDTAPLSEMSSTYKQTRRLSREASAGGGLLTDDRGNLVPHYWGHRRRLRDRFLTGGHKPMPDYEVLELLLFNAIERVDVKPLAKRLLAEFIDLNGVVAASQHRLLKMKGATEKVYLQRRITEAFAQHMGQATVLKREAVSFWDDLITYCRTSMAHRGMEQFRVIFLDRKNVVVADEAQAAGTVDHVPGYLREVAKRAFEPNASAVIMVHNHPSGDPTPSPQDITMTDAVNKACESIGVAIHDQVIIGKDREFSFKSEELFL